MPDNKYDLDVKTLHRETAWWVAREMAGIVYKCENSRFGCEGDRSGFTVAFASLDLLHSPYLLATCALLSTEGMYQGTGAVIMWHAKANQCRVVSAGYGRTSCDKVAFI
jgi:hypothetical protein